MTDFDSLLNLLNKEIDQIHIAQKPGFRFFYLSVSFSDYRILLDDKEGLTWRKSENPSEYLIWRGFKVLRDKDVEDGEPRLVSWVDNGGFV